MEYTAKKSDVKHVKILLNKNDKEYYWPFLF